MKVTIRFEAYPETLFTQVLTGAEAATVKVRGNLIRYETTRTPVVLFEALAKQGIQWWVDFTSVTFERG